ncbi:DNA-binding transcriptional LysR family regulator [Kribbella orskensis]|uniref:DNA-binding transcriptional LysR family regulator n=1 Tax=Kribbella orskensis TaxID=2512216 RepID=A0ABY2BV24_9ACTN|nr:MULTISPECIES: LysR family transcriptional regulator [Kribbella]TCN44080.1 DNA-binding transcriptional LysR family regulator [Kribbella sp. VKM Ac-2500]TCO32142.1 DNA-binding transcriptional LysR family regulator [Kribbella orskensis]
MRYDLDDLRLFVNVVAEGSITAGAARMHLSLPSASARVRALESQAGVALLIRERRGVRPTPAGTTLARHAREVLAQTARLDSAVASYTAARSRPLVLVAGTSAMDRLVPAALASFLREYPEHDVTVSEQRTPRSLRLLSEGKADLGIVSDDEAGSTSLRTELLADDSLVVIGQSGGVLAGRQSLSYADVAEHPMVGLPADAALRGWIDKHLGPHAPVPRYRTLVPTLHALITLATAGVGLAVVPLRSVPPGPLLDIRPLTDPWSTRSHLLCHSAHRPTTATKSLAHHIHLAAG